MTNNQLPIESAWDGYRKELLLFIRSKVNEDDIAEDILSDVFERLIKQLSHREKPANILHWLYRVTKNRIIDHYRAKKFMEELPADLREEEPSVSTLTQLSVCVRPLIESMPVKYRQVMLKCEIQGLKQKDAAKELGLSLSALKSRVLRGRVKLYESLIACCELEKGNDGKVAGYHIKSSTQCGNC